MDDTVYATAIPCNDELSHQEYVISSKSLGNFNVEIYTNPEGEIQGGLISKQEVAESHRVIDLNKTLKFDLLSKLLMIRLLSEDKNNTGFGGNLNICLPSVEVTYLQLVPNGRQPYKITWEEIPTELRNIGNLKDKSGLTEYLVKVIRHFTSQTP